MPNLQKLKYNMTTCWKNTCDFFYKLQPRYMPRVQANLDIRTQLECPVKTFNANKVKPGKDHFNGNFFTLLIIFLYSQIK